MEKVALASDHAGFELKEILTLMFNDKGYEPVDFGTHDTASCDYSDYGHPAAVAVEEGKCAFGIGICGTGNGMAMTLNHHAGIRAGLAWNTDVAKLVKQHNNANFLVIPARFVTVEEAKKIVDAYLEAQFEGGRHQRRIDKIPV